VPVRSVTSDPVDAFLTRWGGTEQAERANYVAFLNELCPIINVPLPDAARGSGGNYRYERGVTHHTADGGPTQRRIDLYRRDRFILEAKQAANANRQTSLFGQAETERRSNIRRSRFWAQSMVAAKGQAEAYVRDLPPDEASPPFLIVCDVGALARATKPATPADVARQVTGAPRGGKIGDMLRVLTALGQARDTGNRRFMA
jgi:hypothetical protein